MIFVTKRNGKKKPYDKRFIQIAIGKAEKELYGKESDLSITVADEVTNYIVTHNIKVISVKQIEDKLLEILKKKNKTDVAKAYEKYRDKRESQRKHLIDKQILDLIDGSNEFLAKENANKNSTLVSTQRDLMAGTISRNLSLRFKIPQFLVEAHNEGLIKLHDLDYFLNPEINCCLIPLDELFTNGTVINNVKIVTPKSLMTAMTLATQIITQVTSYQYGGCTISLSHIAPYVRISKNKYINMVRQEGLDNNINYTEQQIESIANSRLKKEIKDGVQTFNYQINTMNSSNGQLAVYNGNIINY